jgi:hypothetical protein
MPCELFKIAAGYKDILKNLSKSRNVFTMSVPASFQSLQDLKRLEKLSQSSPLDKLRIALISSLGLATSVAPKAKAGKSTASFLKAYGRFIGKRLSVKNINEIKKEFTRYSPIHGNIILNRDAIDAIAAVRGKPKSGVFKKALKAFILAHEHFERSTPKKNILFGHGHVSPEVLLKERNLLAAARGREAVEAADFMKSLGASRRIMSSYIQSKFPSINRYIEARGRMPRATRKFLLKQMLSDPKFVKQWNIPKT